MLDLNWSTILWEIINFLVITVVLYYIVFKPMAIRAEQRAIEKAQLKAGLQKDRAEAAEKLEEIDDRLINLEEEIQKISDEAYASSQLLQKNLLEATYEEANSIMLDAVKEARKEQLVDIRSNQIELVNIILVITKQTLIKATPPEIHIKLLDELLLSIWNFGKTDLRAVQSIRESIEGRSPVVEITVPTELTLEQRHKVINTFSALADKDVDLEETVSPELVAGVKIRIGDIVLDNSIGSQIDAMRDQVTQSLETYSPVQDE